MKTYRVSWEIMLEAETPEAAALEAVRAIRDPANKYTRFAVVDKEGNRTLVDPSTHPETAIPEATRQRATAWLEEAGYTIVADHLGDEALQEVIDNAVHDSKLDEVASLNNEGLDAQIDYLIKAGA